MAELNLRKSALQSSITRIQARLNVPFTLVVNVDHSKVARCEPRFDGSIFARGGHDTFTRRSESDGQKLSKEVFWVTAKKAGTYPMTVVHLSSQGGVVRQERYLVSVAE